MHTMTKDGRHHGLNPILTLDETAELLRVSKSTLYRAAQCGEVPGFKIRGQWRFSLTSVEHMVGGPIEVPTAHDEEM